MCLLLVGDLRAQRNTCETPILIDGVKLLVTHPPFQNMISVPRQARRNSSGADDIFERCPSALFFSPLMKKQTYYLLGACGVFFSGGRWDIGCLFLLNFLGTKGPQQNAIVTSGGRGDLFLDAFLLKLPLRSAREPLPGPSGFDGQAHAAFKPSLVFERGTGLNPSTPFRPSGLPSPPSLGFSPTIPFFS